MLFRSSGVSKQLMIFNHILYQIQVKEGKTQCGEVQFFFYAANEDPEDERNPDAYALVSFYGPCDEDMYEDSFGCLWACTYCYDFTVLSYHILSHGLLFHFNVAYLVTHFLLHFSLS